MSFGEDERNYERPYGYTACPICKERRIHKEGFHGKEDEDDYMCWSCYYRTPEGKRRKAISDAYAKRQEEYSRLRAEFEGEIQCNKECEERKKRYEKMKREFGKGKQ